MPSQNHLNKRINFNTSPLWTVVLIIHKGFFGWDESAEVAWISSSNFWSNNIKLLLMSYFYRPHPEDSGCDANCRITYCHACYYSDEPRSLPDNCNTCQSYPELREAGNLCFKRWAICTRRANGAPNSKVSNTLTLGHYYYYNLLTHSASWNEGEDSKTVQMLRASLHLDRAPTH